MALILQFVLAITWASASIVRIYQHARFYQIEEYMHGRYLRWVRGTRTRWLPLRPVIAAVVGGMFVFTADTIPTGVSVYPYLLGTIAGFIAVAPQNFGEVKKAFRRTPRATRMLGAAFTFAGVFALLMIAVAHTLSTSDRRIAFLLLAGGLIDVLLAPFWLILGNIAMTPVEAIIRQRYLRQARRALDEIQPTVIGITGSYGKTTTKNFIQHLLSSRYHAYATPKSYNTLMGVTLAINTDLVGDYRTQYFIAEMGAYVPGEIRRICQLTPPDISIVVEVGPQHLERFGSLENIAIAKYEIIDQLAPDGLGIFNYDNPYVREMYERGYPQNRIAVSREIDPSAPDAPRFVATDIEESLSGLRFTIHDTQTGHSEAIETPVVGQHNVINLLIATAVAVHEGIPLREVALRARTLQPAESRLVTRTTENGITIINDAYSANPVGVVSALRVLGMHATGKRMLVTPGMVELGPLHEEANRELGVAATQYATDIILVGPEQTAPIRQGVLDSGFPEDRLHIVDALSQAMQIVERDLQRGDTVLFLNDLPDTY